MKKLLLLLTMGLFFYGTFAQTPIKEAKKINANQEVFQSFDGPENYLNQGNFYRTDIRSEWYNFMSPLSSWAGNVSRFSSILFPDTMATVPYQDDQGNYYMGHYGWHSFGQAFDPRSIIYEAFGQNRLLPRQPYTLDSIAFLYFYDKYNDNATKDQLVVKVYGPDELSFWTIGQEPNRQPFCSVPFTRNPFESTDEREEIVDQLDFEDTNSITGRFYGLKMYGLNSFDVDYGGGPVAVTITYYPGQNYNLGDTLGIWTSIDTPYKPLNVFRVRRYYDESQTPLPNYNNGFFVNSQQRYADEWGGPSYGTQYIPGLAWGVSYYTYVSFKITYDADWVDAVEEINENVTLGKIYPNPATNFANLSLSLDNSEYVKIDLVNSLGQTVKTVSDGQLGSGRHLIEMNTTDLNKGVYFVRVAVNDNVVTERFIVE
jgi:hypothetical protein